MKVRYGSELKRLQQERNLLLWAFVLLVILTRREPRGCASTEGCAIARTDVGCA